MAYEQPGFSYTLVANADLRTSQYRFVRVFTTGKAALPADAGRVDGVLQNKPNTNEAATICHDGISMVEAGAAIATPGLALEVGADGRVETFSAGVKVGVSLEAASGAGVFIAVLLKPLA